MVQHSETSVSKVLIAGLGLMGGSLGLELIRLRFAGKWSGHITGLVRSESSRQIAEDRGLADRVYLADEFDLSYADEFDLIVVAIPVAASIRFLESLPKLTRAIVIDLGSTKNNLADSYLKSPAAKKIDFIPCHPMCGSEYSGPSAAVEDLYKEKLCFTFDLSGSLPDSEERREVYHERLNVVREFWRLVGSRVFTTHPDLHDEALAYLSHAPHVLSALITTWAVKNPSVTQLTQQSPMPITGGGFKDMVRIAGSNPEMWVEILDTNRDPILTGLREFAREVESVAQLIETGKAEEWIAFFENAYRAKKFLTEPAPDADGDKP